MSVASGAKSCKWSKELQEKQRVAKKLEGRVDLYVGDWGVETMNHREMMIPFTSQLGGEVNRIRHRQT